jgi:hypothetical protein
MNPATDLYTDEPVRLSGEDRTLLIGLLANYRLMMLLDLKKGQLTENGIRSYRAGLAEADAVLAKLEGRS